MLVLSTLLSAQTEAIPYQTILKDNDGGLLVNVNTAIQVDVLQGSATGPVVYSEIQTTTTGPYGEVSLEIGKGQTIGAEFSEIDWSKQNYLQLSIRPSGFASFIPLGSTRLLSVPYALFALRVTCDQGCPGEDGALGASGPAGDRGITGPQGPSGNSGDPSQPQGPIGDKGPQGLSGLEALKMTDEVPMNPDVGQFYIDDGTNKTNGLPGIRYYDGVTWIDL